MGPGASEGAGRGPGRRGAADRALHRGHLRRRRSPSCLPTPVPVDLDLLCSPVPLRYAVDPDALRVRGLVPPYPETVASSPFRHEEVIEAVVTAAFCEPTPGPDRPLPSCSSWYEFLVLRASLDPTRSGGTRGAKRRRIPVPPRARALTHQATLCDPMSGPSSTWICLLFVSGACPGALKERHY